MTEKKINSFKKGTRCRICTGCGRCFSEKPMSVVNRFSTELPVFYEGVSQAAYIIAADIGTTTIAMQLRRCSDNAILADFTAQNPQRQYGADILSRIEAAADKERADAMKQAVRETVLQGVQQLCSPGGFPIASCKLVIAANTTMIHLLMGLDVSRLGQYPFIPETLSEIRTKLFGLDTLILPGISAFVGADIVAGMEAVNLHRQKETALLLDLGTNGEMVLGNCERLAATATAAGPAFEGSASGYGADLLALAATLIEKGILDETGLLADPYFEEGITIGGVRITEQYIRQLQTAKAAVYTGIVLLCKKYGLQSFDEISRVYLAGGMGYFLNPQAAAALGLLPQALSGKTLAVGNAALEGAFCYGRKYPWQKNKDGKSHAAYASEEAGRYSQGMPRFEVFNLAEEEDFAELYIANMNFTAV